MKPAPASELLRQIVAIPSVNPALSDDPALRDELRLVDWLEPWFAARGFRTARVGATRGRPNLVARFGAESPRKTILFESHLDTVGVAGFAGDPFAMRAAGGRLQGRGACDTKSSGAAMLWALGRYIPADHVV